jgi:hypothetical protein
MSTATPFATASFSTSPFPLIPPLSGIGILKVKVVVVADIVAGMA